MSGPAHILVVDDDTRIRELLQSYLSDHGLWVSAAANAAEAREKMRGIRYDLIVMDVMMPDETGLELTRSLRAETNGVPILILSALAEIENRIEGLSAGGDDYLPKPFEPQELLLRIQNILRRNDFAQPAVEQIQFGDYQFNVSRGELRRDGDVVKLTTREQELMRVLAQRAGEVVARADLTQPGADDSARAVDVQINRLRRKIEENPAVPVYLQTVRGSGYILHVD